MKGIFPLTAMESPKKKPARAGLLIWLVFCWLLLPYPYGLGLFVLSAGWYWTLQRPNKVRRGNSFKFKRADEISGG